MFFYHPAQMELTEIAAVCEVQGMNCPLVLSITAPKAKTLSVSYSLPNVRWRPWIIILLSCVVF